ncbi:MAG: holin family protein [Alphaproteobacteria bacterium]|nr:holin family protein [Alphaproteobacteria bacterium]MCD8570053.1 holin family protein [Alphaproteobacteria bacterium]
MLPALIAKIGLPVLVNVLSEALGSIDTPVTKGAAEALSQVDDALRNGGISPEQLKEANRHAEALAQMQSEEYKASVEQVNQSLRAEIASTDPYVRRMRPTFGYLMAATWAAQMFGIAYVIIFETAQAGEVMAAMASLSAIWAVGLSVMGIYVYKRSEEKQGVAGREIIFWNNPKK